LLHKNNQKTPINKLKIRAEKEEEGTEEGKVELWKKVRDWQEGRDTK
jgi:hypothetical protein